MHGHLSVKKIQLVNLIGPTFNSTQKELINLQSTSNMGQTLTEKMQL